MDEAGVFFELTDMIVPLDMALNMITRDPKV